MTLKEIAEELQESMHCNCDLDKWQPEPDTGHSWVCRIDEEARRLYKLQSSK